MKLEKTEKTTRTGKKAKTETAAEPQKKKKAAASSTVWHYLRGQEAESWESLGSDGEPVALSKLMPTQFGFCLHDNETDFCHDFPFGPMFPHLTEPGGGDISTLLRAVSHARTFPRQEKGPESTAQDPVFGANFVESLAKYNRDLSGWKIHPCLFPGDSIEWSGIWPKWGTVADGVLSVPAMQALPIKEIESGFLPTVLASDWKGRGPNSKQQGIGEWCKKWPTPRASPNENRQTKLSPSQKAGKHGLNLAAVVGELETGGRIPTPRANDAEKRGAIDPENPRNGLSGFVRKFPTVTATDATNWNNLTQEQRKEKGRSVRICNVFNSENLTEKIGGLLNPDWVEWLMGWPVGWTDLEPLPRENWQRWVSFAGWWAEEPERVPRVAKGIPNRVGRIKAIGNGQVPAALVLAYTFLGV